MENIQIYLGGRIYIGETFSGLIVTQEQHGTVVYTAECKIMGRKYKEHKLPHNRYSLATDKPASGVAGRATFLEDVLKLVETTRKEYFKEEYL